MSAFCEAKAQAFNTSWIYAPQSDSLSHVWFRRTWLSEGRPRQATLTITTTGYYKLYVNACNVGTALFYPRRSYNDTAAVTLSFDITPYLRPDTNVVAVLYSPLNRHKQPKQIAVKIYGTLSNGKTFSHYSGNDWLCRRANSGRTTDGGEWVDQRQHNVNWKEATLQDVALWCPAVNYQDCQSNSANDQAFKSHNQTDDLHDRAFTTNYWQSEDGAFIKRIKTLELPTRANSSLHIPLETPFEGFIRATLREAKSGEQLLINGLYYTCSGEIDEQAMPLFNIQTHCSIAIDGDKWFKPSQITNLEIVETK